MIVAMILKLIILCLHIKNTVHKKLSAFFEQVHYENLKRIGTYAKKKVIKKFQKMRGLKLFSGPKDCLFG